MKYQKSIVLLLILLSIILSSAIFNNKKLKYYMEIPPGTAEIDTNFFIDVAEIRNLDWLDYSYWVKRTFGDDSSQTNKVLTDDSLWFDEGYCLRSYFDYYLRHPEYRNHPIIGINQKQAQEYCKWRSDRVFEYCLVNAGIIEHESNQTADNHFTIERYFKGEFNGIKPDERIVYYPVYRLPTAEEWRMADAHFKEYNTKIIKKCRSKDCEIHYQTDSINIAFNVIPCDGDSLLSEAMLPVIFYKHRKKQEYGFHFYGNVSEWLEEENMVVGANWKDTTLLNYDVPREAYKATTTIGFRAVCEWKKWTIE